MLAIPVIAAGLATALVVSTSTHVMAPRVTSVALNVTAGGTLVAEVTPEGLALAPDWLKPCLSQGIPVQPANTPYPAFGSGVRLPDPLDPKSWQGFDCHVLDQQLTVPNWLDPNDIYGSALRHTAPQDQAGVRQVLQQARQQQQMPRSRSRSRAATG